MDLPFNYHGMPNSTNRYNFNNIQLTMTESEEYLEEKASIDGTLDKDEAKHYASLRVKEEIEAKIKEIEEMKSIHNNNIVIMAYDVIISKLKEENN